MSKKSAGHFSLAPRSLFRLSTKGSASKSPVVGQHRGHVVPFEKKRIENSSLLHMLVLADRFKGQASFSSSLIMISTKPVEKHRTWQPLRTWLLRFEALTHGSECGLHPKEEEEQAVIISLMRYFSRSTGSMWERQEGQSFTKLLLMTSHADDISHMTCRRIRIIQMSPFSAQ